MNGRIYDPTLGRFLQADPHIQAPKNSQSYNRYSYVLNNPLSFTDPSGFFFNKLFKGLNKAFGKFAPFVGLALMFIPGVGQWAAASMWNAAALGFVSGGIASGSLKGALIGAFSGAAFQQIGASFKGKFGSFSKAAFGQKAAWAGAHAVTGGITSVLRGGKFGHGFFSAGLTKAFNVNGMIGIDEGLASSRIIAAAVIGGTISKVTGGKFANGAITSGFAQAVNGEQDAAHQRAELKFEKFITRLKKLQGQEAGVVFKNAGFSAADRRTFRLSNACSTRVSVALNENGMVLGSGYGFRPNGDNLITSVENLNEYMTEFLGEADTIIENQTNAELGQFFNGQKGIVLFMSTSGAVNHATAWEQGATQTTDNYSSTYDYERVKLWKF